MAVVNGEPYVGAAWWTSPIVGAISVTAPVAILTQDVGGREGGPNTVLSKYLWLTIVPQAVRTCRKVCKLSGLKVFCLRSSRCIMFVKDELEKEASTLART